MDSHLVMKQTPQKQNLSQEHSWIVIRVFIVECTFGNSWTDKY
jgi:hypothetical protein